LHGTDDLSNRNGVHRKTILSNVEALSLAPGSCPEGTTDNSPAFQRRGTRPGGFESRRDGWL